MRPLALVSVVLFSACGPATAVLLDGDALDDTGTSDTSDPATGDVDTGEVDTEADTDPDTTPRVYSWSGRRDFRFEGFGQGCDDSLIETGIDVTNDPQWAAFRQGCASCNLIFRVEMDKDRLCESRGFQGFQVSTPAVRGLGTVSGQLIVFATQFDDPSGWTQLADADGGWSNFNYEYGGSVQLQGGFEVPFTVEGTGSVQ